MLVTCCLAPPVRVTAFKTRVRSHGFVKVCVFANLAIISFGAFSIANPGLRKEKEKKKNK